MTLTAVYDFLRRQNLQDLRIDSRQIQPGDIFIAVPGLATDGRKYIKQAITNGAKVVLVEAADWNDSGMISQDVNIFAVPNLKDHLADLAAWYYGSPSQKLKVIGITGTNGKTSTSHYVAELLTAENNVCGIMGTLGNGILPNLAVSSLTTSDCTTVQQQLAMFAQAHAQYAVMEVTSCGLAVGRLRNTNFDTAVFTNLSQDHLDFHTDMEDYFAAKCKLFTEFAVKHCVINLDDAYAPRLLTLIPKSAQVITYSIQNPEADLYMDGEKLHTPWGAGILQTKLVGKFNLSNALAAIACCAIQGITLPRILAAARGLHPVNGRMQLLNTDKHDAPKVIVDYAHTPDALVKVLTTLREYQPNKLYCIFGCGGDRDRKKRPLMMRAVIENSDEIIITNDNPRTEDPQQIVQDILQGTPLQPNISIELDRVKAICQTIERARATDIILIAGKGHEDYQIIGTTKLPFSDQEVALRVLNQKKLLAHAGTDCSAETCHSETNVSAYPRTTN